jgi:hypothetical protein
MQITDILGQLGGLQSIARELGVDPAQVQNGAAALAPAILGGFKKQAQSQPGGVAGLGGLLNQLGGGGLLENVLSAQPTDMNRGNAVLGQIFGGAETSRAVAAAASAKSGVDPALLKKMLPMVAMLVAGYMAKQGGGAAPAAAAMQGGGGGGLGGLLGGLANAAQGRAGGASGGGLGGLASMLDLDGDGNPLDDIMGMVGKLGR